VANGDQHKEVAELTGVARRLVNVLALLLVAGKQQAEQVATLNRAGFGIGEIALLVGTTSAVVRQVLYLQRQGKKLKKKG